MTDPLQRALHAAAVHSPFLAALAVFCANLLLFVLMGASGVLAALALVRGRLTWGFAARVAVSLAAAALLTLSLGHLVHDPRPYLAEHYRPLGHVSADNGFPSDHTLVAALLTGWTGWLGRRWLLPFALGTLAVLLGRLAVGAHHTLDVLGSVLIAATGLAVAGVIPRTWTRPLGRRRPAALPGR